tara:strand:- start:3511 stop:3690 length:180 start_codon:yes stop_codon:yes gene_type:complete
MEVNIDFDESQKMWRENKAYIGNGSFKYICGAKCKNGKKCHNKPKKLQKHCHLHTAQKK